jgi:sarcosine oxidase subunit beta
MKNKKSYEVTIIGGGVCGCAIAYHLAKEGVRVALVEKGDICSAASGANLGFSVLSYRQNPITLKMAQDQLPILRELSQELEIDIEYEETGGLILIASEEEFQVLSSLVDRCHEWGFKEIEIVNPQRANQQEPALDQKKIIAAVYCPLEGILNPFNLTIGFANAAKRNGADIYTNSSVIGFEVANKKIEELILPTGRIKTNLVISAAGAWTRELINKVGIDLPIYYERGEAMISSPVSRIIKGAVTDGILFTEASSIKNMIVGACLAQSASGGVILAQSTTEGEDYNVHNSPFGLSLVARRVLTFFPALKNLNIIRMWSGLVSFSEDKQPVFGFLDNPTNMFVITGFHSAIGIASAIGNMVKEVYFRGVSSYDVSAYSPLRFIKKASALMKGDN